MGLQEFAILLGVLAVVWILITYFWKGAPQPVHAILGVVFTIILVVALLKLFGLTNWRG